MSPTLILVLRAAAVPMLTEVSEYKGQRAIAVSCTQLGTEFTSSRARRVVEEWIELLSSRTPLTDLEFTTRTPKRLFAALAGQPQLTRLVVKWGDYADLSPLRSMSGLRHLELRGASAVTDVGPVAELHNLRLLALEGFRTIEDPSPLATVHRLTGALLLPCGFPVRVCLRKHSHSSPRRRAGKARRPSAPTPRPSSDSANTRRSLMPPMLRPMWTPM